MPNLGNHKPENVIYVAGRSGTTAGFAWVGTAGASTVQRRAELSSNEGEYLAVLSAFENLREGSRVVIATSSKLFLSQLENDAGALLPKMRALRRRAWIVAHELQLDIELQLITRSENKAHDLLSQCLGLRKRHCAPEGYRKRSRRRRQRADS
jgi:ribonuclease HI